MSEEGREGRGRAVWNGRRGRGRRKDTRRKRIKKRKSDRGEWNLENSNITNVIIMLPCLEVATCEDITPTYIVASPMNTFATYWTFYSVNIRFKFNSLSHTLTCTHTMNICMCMHRCIWVAIWCMLTMSSMAMELRREIS